MTKKHFIALADTLRSSNPVHFALPHPEFKIAIEQWRRDVHRIAALCERMNPRFKKDLWIAYLAGDFRFQGEGPLSRKAEFEEA